MPMNKLDAWKDLEGELEEGETVEAIVFGEWGWGSFGEGAAFGEETIFVPKDKQGVLMTPDEARPLMKGWSFDGGYGSPACYAVWIWTNTRVFWVTQYDGSTRLNAAPRNPTACVPFMPGG